MSNYKSAEKLWRLVNERNVYYYEIKLKGMVIDRIPVSQDAFILLRDKGVL